MKQSNVKTFVSILCLSLVLTLALILGPAAHAQLIPAGVIAKPATQNTFSVGATNNGATIPIAWCTIPANSLNGGVPVVTALTAGCNTNTTTAAVQTNGFVGGVVAWRVVDLTSANYTNTTTSVPVTATNTFTSGDLILVRHMTTDDYERLTLTTATSGTNLTLLAQAAETILPGDMIYRLSSTNAAVIPATTNSFTLGIPASTSTITFTGARLLCGQKGLPLLLSIQGLSSAEIYNASGYYETDFPVVKNVLAP